MQSIQSGSGCAAPGGAQQEPRRPLTATEVPPELGSFPVGPSRSPEEPGTPSCHGIEGGKRTWRSLTHFPGILSAARDSRGVGRSKKGPEGRGCFLPRPQDRMISGDPCPSPGLGSLPKPGSQMARELPLLSAVRPISPSAYYAPQRRHARPVQLSRREPATSPPVLAGLQGSEGSREFQQEPLPPPAV